MNFNKFTIKGQEAIQGAQQYASELDHQSIENGHLLHGLMQADENVMPFIFNKLSIILVSDAFLRPEVRIA